MTAYPDMTAVEDLALPPFSLFPQRFTGVPLNGISGINTDKNGGDVILAVGNNGAVFLGNGKTMFAPTGNAAGNKNLNAVWVADATTAYVADQNNNVWSSSNLGATAWVNQNAGAVHPATSATII